MPPASSHDRFHPETLPASLPPEQFVLPDGNDSRCDREDRMFDEIGKDGTCSSKYNLIQGLCKPLEAGSCKDSRGSEPPEPANEGTCCSSANKIDDKTCKRPEPVSTGCEDGCCAVPEDTTQGEASSRADEIRADNNCCTLTSIGRGCQKNGSTTPVKSHLELPDRPGCCKNKPSPCCDESCLDRIALRECKDQKSATRESKASKSKLTRSLQVRHVFLALTVHRCYWNRCKLQMPWRQRRNTVRQAYQHVS